MPSLFMGCLTGCVVAFSFNLIFGVPILSRTSHLQACQVGRYARTADRNIPDCRTHRRIRFIYDTNDCVAVLSQHHSVRALQFICYAELAQPRRIA